MFLARTTLQTTKPKHLHTVCPGCGLTANPLLGHGGLMAGLALTGVLNVKRLKAL